MVNPIENFYIYSNSLGGELDLFWKLPAILPENHTIVLFKKEGSEIESDETLMYFALWDEIIMLESLPNPSQGDLELIEQKKQELEDYLKGIKMSVVRFSKDYDSYIDMLCASGIEYFYRIFVLDNITNELSVPLSESAVPQPTIKYTVFDAKDIITWAVQRVVDSLTASSDPVIKIYKEFPIEEGVDQWITVHRGASEPSQRFLGDTMQEWNDHLISGYIEKEVIEVKWYSRNNSSRLDSLNRLFRSHTQLMKRYVLHCGAIEVLFSFMEDSVDSRDTGSNLFYSGMQAAVLSQASALVGLDAAQIFPEFIPASTDS